MKRGLVGLFAAILIAFLPGAGFAAGAHDGLTCTGCHALHTAKDSSLIFAVEANKKDVSSKTKQPYSGITALCLGCHESPEKGGQGIKPIDGHMSHPYGISSINPKIARVPSELLRDGKFECISCHDPHPSNANYKYLRIDTANGSKMDVFCAACHPMKADPKSAAAKSRLFSSMDERGSGSSNDGDAAPAPTKKKANP
jgi:predicted CXXCH cytochrome family protein